MRLTHLKLAGFKSFVDPTTLHIHGQRVGVVGPNGCGKSNVMESVRWVLGESSAKEMRADAMDAVIFNGSGNRKPISRASVELVFDNSLGGASGAWSQYADISVKRVIERDKGSTYYINNTVVRRRDVADLFLGTGLGGRAYAIIGQNTISRIVEAKPDEMRVFLEEAAGVSKYKERRRETEMRLRGTRDNLTRVEDILRELEKQILRLQSQAIVANEYHRLQAALNITTGQIWLLKKREANARWVKSQQNVEKLVNSLEAQMTDLRSSESALETIRQQHVTATEAVNTAQARYYEANALVSNLENQVKNTADARERLQMQLQQLNSQIEKNLAQHASVEGDLLATQADLQTANADYVAAESLILDARVTVSMHLQQYQVTLATFNSSQTTWLNAEQNLRLEQASIGHAIRSIIETTEQIKRLQHSLAELQIPSETLLADTQSQLLVVEAEILAMDALATQAVNDEQQIQIALKAQRDTTQIQQRELHVLEAEINSLRKIQQSTRDVNNEDTLADWLTQFGLSNSQRIWQTLRIKSGWETALEAVLGARLNAIAHDELPLELTRSPVALSIAFAEMQGSVTFHQQPARHMLLSALVEHAQPNYQPVLYDWLTGVYVLDKGADATEASRTLANGECLVNQYGDIYTRHSVTYFGAQSLLHGVLERQARLNLLEIQLPEIKQLLQQASKQDQQLEASLRVLRANQHAHLQQLKSTTQRAHQLNLTLQQLRQQQANALQRKKMLDADRVLAQDKLQKLYAEKAITESAVSDINTNLAQMQAERSANDHKKTQAESLLNQARSRLQTAERTHQEKSFNIKLIKNKISDLNSRLDILNEEKISLKLRSNDLELTLAATQMETLKANLESALDAKQRHEQVLLKARNVMSEHQDALTQQARARMQHEQLLHPLRDKLEAGRLSEQEARLHFEQCLQELSASSLDELMLANSLAQMAESEAKINSLENKKSKLVLDLEVLGAVNLAAIEELATEQARKQYLASQCHDLMDASQTLEDAIRKIDRETKARLQLTFDEANRHFNELFTTLFGGGQARLEMLGEEILDSGMQVFAQPPGKKNSTIHLLSGGEKALTALALVFALFRLNPAPFCLMDEVDAPLDDSNTERFCAMVKKMSERTQFLYVSHNKITMEMAQQLIGVTMQESGVSRIVDVDMEAAVRMIEVIPS